MGAIDENGNTALHLAAKKSDSLQIVKTLVELGCSKSLKNDSGLTPISIAEIEAQIEKDPEKAAKFSAIVKALKKTSKKKIGNTGVVLMKSTELGDINKFKSAIMPVENNANKDHVEAMLNAKDN